MSEVVISKFLETKPRKKFGNKTRILPNEAIANYKQLEKEAIEYLRNRKDK